MAEIKIKKRKPVWPWILLVLGSLVLIYYVIMMNNDDENDNTYNETEIVADDSSMENASNENVMLLSETAKTKIRNFQTYISNDTDMGLDHNYSHNALLKLIDATEATANSLEVDVDADIETARFNAEAITNDPEDLSHSNKIKSTSNIIVQALKKIQVQHYPELDNAITELQQAAMAIAPSTQTLEQKTAVKNFFNQSEQLLTNMINR
ncbi:hypothetical protein ES676_11770 [Bizionia saleffrena]|uniref:Uncharacterized protein n=1 Tax=Bizionia saleffrena TaxID=291189 RepID=A0A8H2QDT9_9FLAO|nr:hypothetical protein [Bizionia saleffrena]TYB71820.1 hypothetical protein ES676_11770 [Bizionia saleffrena]